MPNVRNEPVLVTTNTWNKNNTVQNACISRPGESALNKTRAGCDDGGHGGSCGIGVWTRATKRKTKLLSISTQTHGELYCSEDSGRHCYYCREHRGNTRRTRIFVTMYELIPVKSPCKSNNQLFIDWIWFSVIARVIAGVVLR